MELAMQSTPTTPTNIPTQSEKVDRGIMHSIPILQSVMMMAKGNGEKGSVTQARVVVW